MLALRRHKTCVMWFIFFLVVTLGTCLLYIVDSVFFASLAIISFPCFFILCVAMASGGAALYSFLIASFDRFSLTSVCISKLSKLVIKIDGLICGKYIPVGSVEFYYSANRAQPK